MAITDNTAMDVFVPGTHLSFSRVLYIGVEMVGHRVCLHHQFYLVTLNCFPVKLCPEPVCSNAPSLVGTDVRH